MPPGRFGYHRTVHDEQASLARAPKGEVASLATLAALIGDPSRAAVLTALMADRALSATELAGIAAVAKPTISSHLDKLVEARLLTVERQGRHKYFRLAGPEVGATLESLLGLAFRGAGGQPRSLPADPAMRRARQCYDHLAGDLGVRIHEHLLQTGAIAVGDGAEVRLTARGVRLFGALGLDLATLREGRRTLCRSCLDWTERRHHLAGALGAALLHEIFARRWARRDKSSRALHFSALGEAALQEALGMTSFARSGRGRG
jgi:DNA-binding transcriptional ArsR family regulator